MFLDVRSILSQLALSGGGGGGGGIPNPIPDGLIVQWGTTAPTGSWRWVNNIGPDTLDLAGQPYVGAGGGRSSNLFVSTGAATTNDAGGGSRSGLISLTTGDADQTDPGAPGVDSGSITVQTGNAANTGGGAPGDSGQIVVRTGSATGGGDTGPLTVITGQGSNGGASGPLAAQSGTTNGAGNSGSAVYGTGETFGTGDSGPAFLVTGDTNAGSSGDVGITSGSVAGAGETSGAVFMESGFADDGASGPISVITGDTGNAGNASGPISVITGSPNDGDSGAASLLTGDVDGAARGSGLVTVKTGDSVNGPSGHVDVWGGLANVGDGPRGRVRLGRDDSTPGQEPGGVDIADPLPLALDGADVADRGVFRHQWALAVALTGLQVYGDDPTHQFGGVGGPITALDPIGALVLATSGAAPGDSCFVEPSSSFPNAYRVTDWRGDARPTRRGAVRTFGIVDVIYEWGIRGTPGAFDTVTDADKMFVRFDSATSPNWLFVVSDGGVTDVFDTGVAVTAATTYRFAMRADQTTRIARLWIDGVERSNPAAPLAGAVDLGVPYAGVQTLVAAGRSLLVGNYAIGRNTF